MSTKDRRQGEERGVNSKYAKRRMKTWGYIDAILVDKSYSVADCVHGNYRVVDKIIPVICSHTGEPMTSPEDIALYMPDHRTGDRRKEKP